jgi:hypothetical protein
VQLLAAVARFAVGHQTAVVKNGDRRTDTTLRLQVNG